MHFLRINSIIGTIKIVDTIDSPAPEAVLLSRECARKKERNLRVNCDASLIHNPVLEYPGVEQLNDIKTKKTTAKVLTWTINL